MPKEPSPVRVGMKADEVLKLRGRGLANAVAAPQWIEINVSAVWHYQDCSVVLARKDGSSPYRVTKVVGKGEADINEVPAG
jgi:hypothetical protein